MVDETNSPESPPRETDAPRKRKGFPRWLRLLLGLAFAGVFVYFVGRAGIDLWRDASSAAVVANGVALGITVALTTLWLVAMHAVFLIGLRHCVPGAAVPRRGTAVVFFRSHLARYIPGKVMQVGTLAAGLMKLGCTGRQAASAVVMHQINFMLSTAAFALLLAPLLWRASFDRVDPAIPIAAGTVLVALLLLWIMQPAKRRRAIERVIPKRQRDAEASTPASTLPGRALVFTAYLLLTAGQAVTVAPLAVDLAGGGERSVDPWGWLALCGAYPVARLIGQLGVATPGGLGVREGAYVLLVLPIVGGPAAAAIAAWVRLCAIVSELLVFVLAAARAGKPHARGKNAA